MDTNIIDFNRGRFHLRCVNRPPSIKVYKIWLNRCTKGIVCIKSTNRTIMLHLKNPGKEGKNFSVKLFVEYTFSPVAHMLIVEQICLLFHGVSFWTRVWMAKFRSHFRPCEEMSLHPSSTIWSENKKRVDACRCISFRSSEWHGIRIRDNRGTKGIGDQSFPPSDFTIRLHAELLLAG